MAKQICCKCGLETNDFLKLLVHKDAYLKSQFTFCSIACLVKWMADDKPRWTSEKEPANG